MIGKTISHYRIVDKLGEGGMGVVYRAEDTRLGRDVALKFLPPSISDETSRKRFINEARTASSLDHPNICSIHEIDETGDGRAFIVMPCYDGETLKRRIERGPVSEIDAVSIALQVASGLSKAHEKGIVHRDIKPGNIFITVDGLVKIVDFGLARLSGRTRLTRTGATPGTVSYMSPEQLTGGVADERTDIWSLGAVMYEMIAGRAPFTGDYEQAAIYSIVNGEPEPLDGLRTGLSGDLGKLIDRMLEKDPGKRVRKAVDLVSALREIKMRLESKEANAELDDSGSVPSIAVLPFENMSPDPENRYFGDGLAEELINAFAQIEGLRVASRTSSFRFRGEGADIREIGEALGVSTLLEGSVRRSGNRLRITAQLIKTEDGYHIWSKRFDREMEDIFEIQDEIARSIVDQLRVRLVGEEKKESLIAFGTENLEAYTALLEGRYHLHSLTPEGWERGLRMLSRSIELDPDFAMPHAWLSMFYQSLAWWGTSAPHDVMPRAREEADRAAELDDGLGFAHINRGVVHFCYDWDFNAAEREFLRGLELDPVSGYGHMSCALFYSSRGRSEEAIVEARLALRLEPLDGLISAWIAAALNGAGAAEEAIDVCLRALKFAQEHWQLHMFLGGAYMLVGREDEAIPGYGKAIEMSGEASFALAGYGVFCYLTGREGEGDDLLGRLIVRSGRDYVPPSLLARLEIARGNIDAARPHVERAVEARDLMMVSDNMWPRQSRISGTELEPLMKEAGL